MFSKSMNVSASRSTMVWEENSVLRINLYHYKDRYQILLEKVNSEAPKSMVRYDTIDSFEVLLLHWHLGDSAMMVARSCLVRGKPCG